MTSTQSAPTALPTSSPVATTITLAVLGIFVTYLPITSISGALTTIGAATDASTTQLQWIADAYVIPMAAAVLSAGVFGDIYGRRRIFLIGMALTIIGGLIAGIGGSILASDSAISAIWAAQAVSGIGAGLLIPTTLALIAQAVPDHRARGKYIGMWSTGLMAGLAFGPIISGLVLRAGSWPWIYTTPTLLALGALVTAWIKLPESAAVPGRKLDWGGQITATVMIAASIFGIIEGSAQGWTSWQAVTGLGLGAAMLIAFLIIERRSTAPLMELSLFRSIAFSASSIAGLIALFSIVGAMFLLSIFLGTVQGLDTLEIGARLFFGAGIGALIGPAVAKLIFRFAPMQVLTVGLTVSAFGLLALTFIDASTGLFDVGWRLAIFGIGNTMMLSSVTTAAINSAPLHQAGMASATNTAIRQYGSALGPALLGAIFTAQIAGGATMVEAFSTSVMANVILLFVTAILCGFAAAHLKRTKGTQAK